MIKLRFLTAFALVATLFVASCANTVRGVATDVKGTVDAVDDSVN